MKANPSILQCPNCKRGLVGIGSKLERIHPIPRYIKNNFDRIFPCGILATFPLLYAFVELTESTDLRGIMFAWFGLIAIASVILFLIPKFFDVYRITDCPNCGFHDEDNIGKGLDI